MAPTLAAGTLVGGFRIKRVLADGATGCVYVAQAPDGNEVALKVLSPELGTDERFRRRFLRESELARALDHPNVVPTLAGGAEGDVLYLAMRYVDGPDLRTMLQSDGALEPRRALELLGQVADALDAAHAKGLVHRDVKPGNILIASTRDGERAFVCDFGLARHLSSPSSLTGDRGFVGTVDFVPPEQIEGGTIDARADVYSLGCVLFACLTGASPFERESELAVVYAHLNEPPPRLSGLRPELPSGLDDVVATALAKRPEDRYASCRELIDSTHAALDGRTVRRGRRRRRRIALPVAVLLLGAGAALGGLFGFGHDAHASSITPTSIAGAKLGLPAGAYEHLFGPPWRWSTQKHSGHRILSFPRRAISVYFRGFTDTAVEIITWNGAYRTAAGIGPCSSIARAKRIYGRAFVRSPKNTIHGKTYAYLVSRSLIFAANGRPPHPSPTVTAVAIFYSDAPDAANTALPYATYLAIDARTSCANLTKTS